MKIDGTHAALERFKLTRADEDHRLDPELPDDVGIVHALIARPHDLAFVKPGQPRFAERWEHWSAVCGRRVRVALQQAFNTDDEAACEKCARTLAEPDVDAG